MHKETDLSHPIDGFFWIFGIMPNADPHKTILNNATEEGKMDPSEKQIYAIKFKILIIDGEF